MNAPRSTRWLALLALAWASGVLAAGELPTPAEETASVSSARLNGSFLEPENEPSGELDPTRIEIVPEPQALLLAALAGCGLLAVHLRRRWG